MMCIQERSLEMVVSMAQMVFGVSGEDKDENHL